MPTALLSEPSATVPAAADEVSPHQQPDQETAASLPRILIVDDNPSIHIDIRKTLQPADAGDSADLDALEAELFGAEDAPALAAPALQSFAIDSAYQGEEALEKVRAAAEQGLSYSMAFIDMRMPPGWDGLDTIEQLWTVDPELHVVICTAYSDYSWAQIAARLGDGDQVFILKKPFETEEILQMAHALCQKREAGRYLRQMRQMQQRALFNDNPGLLFSLDACGVVRDVSHAAAERLGGDPARFNGQAFSTLLPRNERADFDAAFAACLGNSSNRPTRWEGRLDAAGGPLHVKAELRLLPISDGIASVLLSAQDVSEIQALLRQMQRNERVDPLTGLLNRAAFEQRLLNICDDLYFANAHRDETSCALLFVDVDNFHVVNDTFGYAGGDRALVALSQQLQRMLPGALALARIDGDRFAALLKTNAAGARAAAERCRAQIEAATLRNGDKTCGVTVSVGAIALGSGDSLNDDLLRFAIAAVRVAKEHGGNRVHYAAENDGEIIRRRDEVRRLGLITNAIADNRLRLFSQPIAPLNDGEPGAKHYEILVRLIDEQNNVIQPADFIPLAERYRLAYKLDRWVVQNTLFWLADHPDALAALDCCSINLSDSTAPDPHLLSFLIEQFTDSGVPPGKICFEITEKMLTANPGEARRLVDSLRSLGCRFALDDFGVGTSSLTRLCELPVDFIKIDGAFVKRLDHNSVADTVVRAVNEIAHAMDKRTIAEGVENDAVLARLSELGIDYAQGFGIGRPQPLAAAAEAAASCG